MGRGLRGVMSAVMSSPPPGVPGAPPGAPPSEYTEVPLGCLQLPRGGAISPQPPGKATPRPRPHYPLPVHSPHGPTPSP